MRSQQMAKEKGARGKRRRRVQGVGMPAMCICLDCALAANQAQNEFGCIHFRTNFTVQYSLWMEGCTVYKYRYMSIKLSAKYMPSTTAQYLPRDCNGTVHYNTVLFVSPYTTLHSKLSGYQINFESYRTVPVDKAINQSRARFVSLK